MSEPFIARLDDATYYAGRGAINGLMFIATLQIRTPLAILMRHGEKFDGPFSKAPKIGTEADGIWTFDTKPLVEGIEPFRVQHASDVGSVWPEDYLPFLKVFRKIVESEDTDAGKLARLELMSTHKPFKGFWQALQKKYADFPTFVFYQGLRDVKGVGPALAATLYEHKIANVRALACADPDFLAAIKGVGKAKAAKLIEAARAAR